MSGVPIQKVLRKRERTISGCEHIYIYTSFSIICICITVCICPAPGVNLKNGSSRVRDCGGCTWGCRYKVVQMLRLAVCVLVIVYSSQVYIKGVPYYFRCVL